MRDEVMEIFAENLGEPTHFRPVPADEVERYRGVLPDKLLQYWQELGWSGFADGLLWLVNPADYDHRVAMWLEDTPFESLDTYRAIARSAFGKLYVWGKKPIALLLLVVLPTLSSRLKAKSQLLNQV